LQSGGLVKVDLSGAGQSTTPLDRIMSSWPVQLS
jgi:hypothetical protein